MCVPRRFETWTGADGSHELLLPALYVNPCTEITLEASATGYESLSVPVSVADLRAQPVRDLVLVPLPTPTATPRILAVYLPLLMRERVAVAVAVGVIHSPRQRIGGLVR